ncbi:hypothetical protein CPB85DRAFT_1247629 [Mucidula mucida]|nr:hypothetical protein CPB85DRAFT_1247629 [Mucidula mucida]
MELDLGKTGGANIQGLARLLRLYALRPFLPPPTVPIDGLPPTKGFEADFKAALESAPQGSANIMKRNGNTSGSASARKARNRNLWERGDDGLKADETALTTAPKHSKQIYKSKPLHTRSSDSPQREGDQDSLVRKLSYEESITRTQRVTCQPRTWSVTSIRVALGRMRGHPVGRVHDPSRDGCNVSATRGGSHFWVMR